MVWLCLSRVGGVCWSGGVGDHGEDWVSAGKVGWGQVLECFECHTSSSGICKAVVG